MNEISASFSHYLEELGNVQEQEKIYINSKKKICIDNSGFLRPLIRTLYGRSRYTTIEELEKIFASYFILIDNIFTYESKNHNLLTFHLVLIESLITGLSNLKFTYEDSKTFEMRANILLIKLIKIKRQINYV